MSIRTQIGPVTAYADAVMAGYTGTREQWAEDMAKLGENLAAVRTEREKAEDAAQTAVDARDTAVQTINTARDDAVADVNEAADTRIEEINAMGVNGTVRFDEAQELSAEQQATARSNIGAGGAIVETAQGDGVVTVNDSAAAALRGLRIFGKSTQNTTTGINLFAIIPDNTAHGVTLTYNGDGSYTLNGTCTTSYLFSVDMQLDAGEYSLICEYTGTLPDSIAVRAQVYGLSSTNNIAIGNNSPNRTVVTATMESGTVQMRIRIEAGHTYNNVVLYPMFVKGTYTSNTMPPFEPYTGGKPSPSPDYPQPIVSAGDDGEINISITETAQALAVSTPNGLPGIPVTSDGNYTDAAGQQWVCDEIDFGRGVYMQRIDKIVFNGTESVLVLPNDDLELSIYARFTGTGTGQHVADAQLLCDKFANRPIYRVDNEGIMCEGSATSYSVCIRINKSRLTEATSAGVRAWLHDNPVTVYLTRITPVETPLTEEQLAAYRALRTQYPTTNVTNDEGVGMEVSYVADTKTYIDNKFAELSAAILNA